MLTVDEYLARHVAFKSEPFNFRANPENKRFIATLKKQHRLDNEALAFDYIIECFKDYTRLAEDYKSLQQKLTQLQAQQNTQQPQPVINPLEPLVDNRFYPPISFVTLSEKLCNEIAGIFAQSSLGKLYPQLATIGHIPLSTKDVIDIMASFCENDPTGEFPQREPAETILKKYLDNNGQAQQPTQESEPKKKNTQQDPTGY